MKLATILAALVVAAPLAAQTATKAEKAGADSAATRRFAFRFAFRFNPDWVLRNRVTIDLEQTQQSRITMEVEDATRDFSDIRMQLQAEQRALDMILEQPRVSETAALEALDRVLRLESLVKRSRLRLLIRTKNTLTPAQQELLQQIDGGSQ